MFLASDAALLSVLTGAALRPAAACGQSHSRQQSLLQLASTCTRLRAAACTDAPALTVERYMADSEAEGTYEVPAWASSPAGDTKMSLAATETTDSTAATHTPRIPRRLCS